MRTSRHPYDYEKRIPTPPDELFAICPSCGYRFAVLSGERLDCYKCNTLDQPAPICDVCREVECLNHKCPPQIPEAVEISLGEMTLDEQKEWFGKVEPVEFGDA